MKKWTTFLAAAVLSAGLLSGCGKETYQGLAEMKTEDYVTLGQYTGLTASGAKTQITQEDVDMQLYYMQLQNNGTLEEVTDRPVQMWDTATIDYEGKLDGVAFDGGTAQGYDLVIGSGNFIEGFEEGLIGVNAGETVEIPLTFPEGYQNAEMAGKDVVFTVTVQKIMAYTLTDEFAQQMNEETKTAEELRQAIQEILQTQADQSYDLSIQSQLMDQISAGCEWKRDIPDVMVQKYMERLKNNLMRYAEMSNMAFGEFLSARFGIEESQFEENFKESAMTAAREDMILQAIANAQNLNPTEEEIEQLRAEEVEQGGYESMEAYKEAVGEEYYTRDIRDYLMADKVTAYLKENAEISE